MTKRNIDTLREAARKGGETTAAKYKDTDHYSRIGRKGGKKSSKDRERMRAIGRLGGLAGKGKKKI